MPADPATPSTISLPADTYRLRLPGPVPVPERVRIATASPILNHRGPEFRAIWTRVAAGLAPIVGTKEPVIPLAASGTGAMEAAILNIVAPGERVLVVENGQWGERFSAIVRALGAIADPIVVPWGAAVDPGEIEARLRQHAYRALVVVHNESSTGVAADLETAGRLVAGTPTLLVTDSVSGLAGLEMRMDAWGVDIVVAGSQKALMCPPGLAFVAASAKAWEVIRRDSGMPRFYLDLRRARDAFDKGESAFTPAVSLVMGLDAALAMIAEEGLANVLARHARCCRMLKAGAAALGLANFATATRQSSTVACFHVPDGIDGSRLIRRLYEKHRTVIAGARNRLQGRMIRVGTLGVITESDVLTDLVHLADVLAELGHRRDIAPALAAALSAR